MPQSTTLKAPPQAAALIENRTFDANLRRRFSEPHPETRLNSVDPT